MFTIYVLGPMAAAGPGAATGRARGEGLGARPLRGPAAHDVAAQPPKRQLQAESGLLG